MFSFELASPTQLIFSGEVEQVDLPGAEGDFGVLTGHAPLVAMLRPGLLTIHDGKGDKRLFVQGGFAEVNTNGLTVLAEVAVPLEHLDRAALADAIRQADEAVAAAPDEAARWKAIEALEQLKTAQAQLGAAAH